MSLLIIALQYPSLYKKKRAKIVVDLFNITEMVMKTLPYVKGAST